MRKSKLKSMDSVVLERGDVLKHLLFLGLQDASKVLTKTTMSITDNDPTGECFRAVVLEQRGSDWTEGWFSGRGLEELMLKDD